MMWILIYVLVGVAVVALMVVNSLPFDVQVGDVIIAPLLVLLWPGLVLFLVFECRLLEQRLFTIGRRLGEGDGNTHH